MVTHPSLQNAGPRLRYLINRFIEDRLNANAAALTFVSLFAFLPLLTVTLSIASALPAAGDIEAKLSDFLSQFLLPREFRSGRSIPLYLYRPSTLTHRLWCRYFAGHRGAHAP